MRRPPRWLLRAAQLVLAGLITWGLYRMVGVDLGRLNAREFARWRPAVAPLAASTGLLLAVFLAHALLWRRIVGDVLGRAPSITAAMRVYFVSALGRYIPGKLWQLTGLALLARRAGIPAVPATAAALIGQIGFLTTGGLFLTLLLPGWAGPGPALAAALVMVVLAGTMLWLATGHGARTRAALVRRFPLLESAVNVLARIRPREALLWVIGYGITWVMLGLAFSLFVIAFAPGASGSTRHLAGTVAAAYLGGYVAVFAPAGVGVREGVMAVLLAQVVPAPAAFLVSVASRLWFTVAELLPLAVLLLPAPGPAAPSESDGRSVG